ncbi:hypothetical protein [Lentibacillus sp. Marseille-P4043]|uniref:hypothetical protein n=1 Tax=Lentibacillus sp. Marseille-P4043 TaxID=2040293 RepID=UPI000D0B1684|nr:hypothetical protein [Lentibacillus sp. Marseille-P4043]
MTARIRVGRELVKPKAIHVYKDGQWQKKRVGYVYKNGQWIEFIKYLIKIYENGLEFIKLESFDTGNGEAGWYPIERRDDYLYSESYRVTSASPFYVRTSFPSWVTANPINLTEHKQIKIRWILSVIRQNPNPTAYLVVSTIKQAGYTENDAIVSTTVRDTIVETILDVGDLTGDFYIRTHVPSGDGLSSLKIYSIEVV